MASRKEEERNEKIIRGLMKLPPNRRCINCDSQGPQYVCTNFWTFICVTCSGIHREFTHRVKSVSMSKFNSQEVDALQKGGNQRAREIFLKNWDMQSQKLPTSSNVDRIREFIKSVYVERKYAEGRSSDKPPRDLTSHKSGEEEHRRASSYHSFSQSPPYDHQYEDRLYGKQNHMLTRKPGSERGLYDGKLGSFLYSPGRKREEIQEERFANEGSAPRYSDFSVSSSGEAFGSGVQSPNFQRDMGSTDPISKPIREILIEDAQNQKLGLQPDATVQINSDYSLSQTRMIGESFASDGKAVPLDSVTPVNLFENARDTVNPGGGQPAKVSVMPSQPSAAVHTLDDDLFAGPVKPTSATNTTQAVDLFAGFDAPPLSRASSAEVVDLFADNFHQTSYMPSSIQRTVSAPPPFVENDDWAQFDVPQFSVSQMVGQSKPSSNVASVDEISVGNFPPFLSSDNGSQLPSEQGVFPQQPTSLSNKNNLTTQTNDLNPQIFSTLQSWDAFIPFGNSSPPSFEGLSLKDEVHIQHKFSSNIVSHTELEFLEDSSQTEIMANQAFPISDGSVQQEKKSFNPFDLPFESDLEPSNMFVDMSSLQAALSNTQAPGPFLSNVGQAMFPRDHLLPYMTQIPSGYVPGPAPSSQLADLPLRGPGASLGGNPFALQPPSPQLANLPVQGAGPSMSGNPFA